MSKSKSKGSKDTTKSQSDVLTKVKDAAVVKPAQTVKAKAKDLAKAVVGKEEKKSKQKKVKEPTPEPSDSESEESESESDESESSADSDSDSESEAEVKKPTANGKANGAKKVAAAESSDESDSSESSSDEAPAKKTNGAKQPAAKADSDSESDEASDSDDSKDEIEEKPKAVEAKAKKETKTKVASSDDESDADSDDSGSDDSEEDSDDSDDSDESEEETKPKQVTNKRKAEEEAVPAAKKTKTETDSAAPETGNLFVGNLSWNVDEDWLTREFETFGELSGVRIITDRESGRSKGFGYVEFVNPADAAKAHAAKAGSELDGRNINVDFAVKREQGAKPQDRANDRRKSYGDSTSDPSDTLFCGNLSFDADQDTISQAFAEYGTVLGVRLPTDRETGAPKGFGYVTFSSVEEAGAAMEAMNGAEIAGRSVRLDYSQPRPQNGDSPARGRGGFGGGRGFGERGGRGGGRGFGDRGGRGGGRGRGFGDRGGRGGRGASTNRGGFGDFSGKKTTF